MGGGSAALSAAGGGPAGGDQLVLGFHSVNERLRKHRHNGLLLLWDALNGVKEPLNLKALGRGVLGFLHRVYLLSLSTWFHYKSTEVLCQDLF